MTKNERNRAWYAAHRDQERQKRRDYYYKNRAVRLLYEREQRLKNYGIFFERFILEQNGRCRICSTELKRAQLDHDHKTGKLRGLLCHHCNVGLGNFFDSVELLEKAIDYIKENENGKKTIKHSIADESHCPPRR